MHFKTYTFLLSILEFEGYSIDLYSTIHQFFTIQPFHVTSLNYFLQYVGAVSAVRWALLLRMNTRVIGAARSCFYRGIGASHIWDLDDLDLHHRDSL